MHCLPCSPLLFRHSCRRPALKEKDTRPSSRASWAFTSWVHSGASLPDETREAAGAVKGDKYTFEIQGIAEEGRSAGLFQEAGHHRPYHGRQRKGKDTARPQQDSRRDDHRLPRPARRQGTADGLHFHRREWQHFSDDQESEEGRLSLDSAAPP